MEEFKVDGRLKPLVFWAMVELLEAGMIQESDIKKELYLSEYKRYMEVRNV